MEVLDLGNNQILDTFPLLLTNISTLRVLVLRSNKFYGHIGCPENIGAWPVIQIVDVASNNFSGELPKQCLTKWHGMMAVEGNTHSQLNHLRFNFFEFNSSLYYQDAVTVTNKCLEMELVKILTVFTSIDFSSNQFHGELPIELGQLKSLYVLNLSNNALGGQIPSSLGNLPQLESLDLSNNSLNGEIPTSLTNLNFLSFLNLSNNQLSGKIPTGNQIQTFSTASFQGNKGLCGAPFTENCTESEILLPKTPKNSYSNSSGIEIEWDLISAEIGFVAGFGIVIVPLVFSNKWRKWYFHRVEDIAFSILPVQLLRKWLLWKMSSKKTKKNKVRKLDV